MTKLTTPEPISWWTITGFIAAELTFIGITATLMLTNSPPESHTVPTIGNEKWMWAIVLIMALISLLSTGVRLAHTKSTNRDTEANK